MAGTRSPVSPNFSMPYSVQHPFHSPFETHELEHSTQYSPTRKSSSNGDIDRDLFSHKGANVEAVEQGSSGGQTKHTPIYDRLDSWFGGRMDLELVLLCPKTVK